MKLVSLTTFLGYPDYLFIKRRLRVPTLGIKPEGKGESVCGWMLA